MTMLGCIEPRAGQQALVADILPGRAGSRRLHEKRACAGSARMPAGIANIASTILRSVNVMGGVGSRIEHHVRRGGFRLLRGLPA